MHTKSIIVSIAVATVVAQGLPQPTSSDLYSESAAISTSRPVVIQSIDTDIKKNLVKVAEDDDEYEFEKGEEPEKEEGFNEQDGKEHWLESQNIDEDIVQDEGGEEGWFNGAGSGGYVPPAPVQGAPAEQGAGSGEVKANDSGEAGNNGAGDSNIYMPTGGWNWNGESTNNWNWNGETSTEWKPEQGYSPEENVTNEPNHDEANEVNHDEYSEPQHDEFNEPNHDEGHEANHEEYNEPNSDEYELNGEENDEVEKKQTQKVSLAGYHVHEYEGVDRSENEANEDERAEEHEAFESNHRGIAVVASVSPKSDMNSDAVTKDNIPFVTPGDEGITINKNSKDDDSDSIDEDIEDEEESVNANSAHSQGPKESISSANSTVGASASSISSHISNAPVSSALTASPSAASSNSRTSPRVQNNVSGGQILSVSFGVTVGAIVFAAYSLF